MENDIVFKSYEIKYNTFFLILNSKYKHHTLSIATKVLVLETTKKKSVQLGTYVL